MYRKVNEAFGPYCPVNASDEKLTDLQMASVMKVLEDGKLFLGLCQIMDYMRGEVCFNYLQADNPDKESHDYKMAARAFQTLNTFFSRLWFEYDEANPIAKRTQKAAVELQKIRKKVSQSPERLPIHVKR